MLGPAEPGDLLALASRNAALFLLVLTVIAAVGLVQLYRRRNGGRAVVVAFSFGAAPMLVLFAWSSEEVESWFWFSVVVAFALLLGLTMFGARSDTGSPHRWVLMTVSVTAASPRHRCRSVCRWPCRALGSHLRSPPHRYRSLNRTHSSPTASPPSSSRLAGRSREACWPWRGCRRLSRSGSPCEAALPGLRLSGSRWRASSPAHRSEHWYGSRSHRMRRVSTARRRTAAEAGQAQESQQRRRSGERRRC